MWNRGSATLAIALVLLPGCAHVTTQVIEHRDSDGTQSGYVPQNGQYLLWMVRSKGHEHQLQACTLHKGEVLGFDTANGQLAAVAGAQR